MPIGSAPSPSYRRVMIFIDGGYIRECLKEKFGKDDISPDGFQNLIHSLITYVHFGTIRGELIRTYYYDAIVDENEKDEREKQNQFFDVLRQVPFCTVRLGRLIKTEKEHRQKGVDILMAIDMLTKSYENHYEIAILLCGDDDFIDLVEAVKNTGKRVYGAYIPRHVSNKLLKTLDIRISLDENSLKKLIS